MSVVTVCWLQPPRYCGMEETVSRSRVRQRGQLTVGDEVRVRYKRCYYKAQIINFDGHSPTSVQPVDHPSIHSAAAPGDRSQHPATDSSRDGRDAHLVDMRGLGEVAASPLSQPAGPMTLPLLTSTPVQASLLAEVPATSDSFLLETTSGFQLHQLSPWQHTSLGDQMDTPLPRAWVDSVDSVVFPEDSSMVAEDVRGGELTVVAPEQAVTVVDPEEAIESYLHECIDQELLDDIVLSVGVIPNQEPSVTAVERFRVFLLRSIVRVRHELFPRVLAVLQEMRQESRPCERCLGNLGRTLTRLGGILDDLNAFLIVADRTMHLTPEE